MFFFSHTIYFFVLHIHLLIMKLFCTFLVIHCSNIKMKKKIGFNGVLKYSFEKKYFCFISFKTVE